MSREAPNELSGIRLRFSGALNQLDSDLQFMTIGQAARLCDESRSTISEWVESGRLAVRQRRSADHAGLAIFEVLRRSGQTDFPKPNIPEAD